MGVKYFTLANPQPQCNSINALMRGLIESFAKQIGNLARSQFQHIVETVIMPRKPIFAMLVSFPVLSELERRLRVYAVPANPVGLVISVWIAQAPVAQLDRAPDYESGGWGFKSLRARHQLLVGINITPSDQQAMSQYGPDKLSYRDDARASVKSV
jgi:K+-transporting ATPase A subunit